MVWVCAKAGLSLWSSLARLAVLPLGGFWRKRSSFLGFRRVEVREVGLALVVVEVLMREERWELKERLLEVDEGVPLVRLWGLGL